MGQDFDQEREHAPTARPPATETQQSHGVPGRNTTGDPGPGSGPGTTAPGRNTGGPEKPPGPAGDPPPVKVGDRFGSAHVVRHQTISREGTPMAGQPGPKLTYDRYIVMLKNGNTIAVDIPRTPKDGIPWGQTYNAGNAALDRQVDQARRILEAIGSKDPKLFHGVPVIDAATSGLVQSAKPDPVRAGGWRRTDNGWVTVTNEGITLANVKDVIAHEGGHAVGYHLAPGIGYTDGFKEALAADGKMTANAKSFAQYPDAQLREAYADAQMKYSADPAGFAREHPAQAKIIERDLARLDDMFAKGPPGGYEGPQRAGGADGERAAGKPGQEPHGGTGGRSPGSAHDPHTTRAPGAGSPHGPSGMPGPGASVASSVTGKVVRKVATAAASPVVTFVETVIDVMTPGRAGPSGWHRNDRQDWQELLAEGNLMMKETPGLSMADAVIRAAEQRGRPLAEHIIRDLRELDKKERNERAAREDQARTREFYEKNYSYKRLNQRKPPQQP
jgi:hypothetical protein